jgi:hypothetical protein
MQGLTASEALNKALSLREGHLGGMGSLSIGILSNQLQFDPAQRLDEFRRCGVDLVFLNYSIGQLPEDRLLLQMQGRMG